jgi:hypothetical protein
MNKRTTIVLGAVAVGLLAFILFHERHLLSSRDMEGRHDRLLERFVRDEVTRIDIERGGQRISLVHEREDEDDVLGTWNLVEPVQAPADENTVESLLGSLEWANARRTIEGIDDGDRERFGLVEPELQAWFTVKKERVPIAIGSADPTEGGRYVQLDDPTVVYVVGKDFTEALDRDAGHFRSKVLFPDGEPGDARELSLGGQGGARELALRDGRWWLRAPFEAWAEDARVEAALEAAVGIKATRYVVDSPNDLEQYGLEGPSLHVKVRGAEEGDGDASPWEAVLRVGSDCGEHTGELYARAGSGPVVCVRANDLEPLRPAAEDLRQTRLSTVREPELVSASVERGGRKLLVEGTDGELRFRAGQAEGEVDSSALADWLRMLSQPEVTAFEALDAGSAARFGLARPRATLELGVGDAGPDTVLYLGGTTDEGVWVRRGSEPFALRVPASVEEAFDPSPVRFRNRLMVQERDGAATRIVVVRDGTTERAERGEDGWRVHEPMEVPADPIVIRSLIRRLGNLEADRFVAERPTASHGLSSPRWTVTMRFEGALPKGGEAEDDDGEGDAPAPREHVLRIGAPADRGAYAQLGSDPAVFVLPQVIVDDLASPLVDRNLLATGRNDLKGLRIERSGRTLEIVRDDGGWKLADGSAEDPEGLRRLVDRVGALRASSVTGYGAPPSDHGLQAPRARVTVTRKDGAGEPREYTFVIGATEGDDDAARTHVRRQGLEVGLAFPTDVMETFVTFGS